MSNLTKEAMADGVQSSCFVILFLSEGVLERPFVMFPVGHPLPGVLVPDLARKALAEVLVVVDGT